ncbi:iron permease [Hygrophoropsis aurantiaca]|uniref:Iron permease n=1 Tax=Hygrophoropsis aurantiaca TaxID=72124 RepID=A0ACB8A590_9AGAM|nr:iron permease [Hygrophoropsis aurantiaca]
MSDTSVSSDLKDTTERPQRGWRFWLIFLALCASTFLSALDLASIATALPSIVHNLNGTESFAWVSAAYTLACTSILPLSGKLADIFGRREVMLTSLLSFALGSVLCATAKSMTMLIAGRAIQGVGSGGIQSLTAIVISDLVTLKERGFFIALTGATYSLATAVGPFVGGAFAQDVTWRWLFYLNLPLCGIALIIVAFFMRLRKPPSMSLRTSLLALDWIGNTLIIGGTTSCLIALTWAGVTYSWQSFQIIVPLVIGLVALAAALLYETCYASHPTVPRSILSNRTSLSGYFGTFLHGAVSILVFFYLPIYFQAAKLASPLRSGLYFFPMAFAISPAAIAQGIIISKTGRYRLVNFVGWSLMFLGIGLLCLLHPDSSIGESIPFQLIAAVGMGLLYATQFSVLAPLDPKLNAQALSFLIFTRSFSQSWSVSIGATILQNRLLAKLPGDFVAGFAPGADISYTAIPQLPSLPPPIRDEARTAFADSLIVLWKVAIVVCAVGLLSVFAQKSMPLHQKMDGRWGMEENARKDEEIPMASMITLETTCVAERSQENFAVLPQDSATTIVIQSPFTKQLDKDSD